jgi:hypothetical protein
MGKMHFHGARSVQVPCVEVEAVREERSKMGIGGSAAVVEG